MLPIRLLAAFIGSGPKVNLDGETISNVEADPTNASAVVRFNSDGTVDKLTGNNQGVTTQIDAGTDWILPNGSGGGDSYEVRLNSTPSPDAFTTSAAAAGTWTAISASPKWGYDRATVGTLASGNVTFQIRIAGQDKILASATYNLTAQVT